MTSVTSPGVTTLAPSRYDQRVKTVWPQPSNTLVLAGAVVVLLGREGFQRQLKGKPMPSGHRQDQVLSGRKKSDRDCQRGR